MTCSVITKKIDHHNDTCQTAAFQVVERPLHTEKTQNTLRLTHDMRPKPTAAEVREEQAVRPQEGLRCWRGAPCITFPSCKVGPVWCIPPFTAETGQSDQLHAAKGRDVQLAVKKNRGRYRYTSQQADTSETSQEPGQLRDTSDDLTGRGI